jgi:cytochrome c5
MQGKGSMPAKGGEPGLDEKEIRAAVKYMVENSK